MTTHNYRMTEDEINDWISRNNIALSIYSHLEGFDGRLLRQLHIILQRSPEGFLKLFMEGEKPGIPKPDIFQLVHFTLKLEELFTKERNDTDHIRRE
jgi:hypothetical protein